MRRSNPKQSSGYTLIEVILAIVFISLMAFALSLGIDSISASRLDSAVRRLASDLRFAQQVAVTKRIRHGIVFTANSYTVFENDLPGDPARNPQGGNDFVVDFTTGDFAGVTISTTPPQKTLPGLVVKFEPNGKPIDGANAPLTNATNQVTLSYNGSPKALTITHETGRLMY